MRFALLLILALPASVLRAQTIKIKLVNGKNGQSMANTFVNVWVGSERKDAMAIPTDKDGVARLYLTDKDGEVKTQSPPKSSGEFAEVHPVVKYAENIRVVAGYVICQPNTPNYSWLATLEFSTKQIVQQGIITTNSCGKSTGSPTPGEVVIFVRPLTWWEMLRE
jgi:hypothetical protein